MPNWPEKLEPCIYWKMRQNVCWQKNGGNLSLEEGWIVGLVIGLIFNFSSLYLAQTSWISPWKFFMNILTLNLWNILIECCIGHLSFAPWFSSFSPAWRRFVLKSCSFLNPIISSKLLDGSSSTLKRKIESLGKGKLSSTGLELASFRCWRSSSTLIRGLRLFFISIVSSSSTLFILLASSVGWGSSWFCEEEKKIFKHSLSSACSNFSRDSRSISLFWTSIGFSSW